MWSLVILLIVEVITSDQIHIWGTSLEAQSLGLHTSTSGGTGLEGILNFGSSVCPEVEPKKRQVYVNI